MLRVLQIIIDWGKTIISTGKPSAPSFWWSSGFDESWANGNIASGASRNISIALIGTEWPLALTPNMSHSFRSPLTVLRMRQKPQFSLDNEQVVESDWFMLEVLVCGDGISNCSTGTIEKDALHGASRLMHPRLSSGDSLWTKWWCRAAPAPASCWIRDQYREWKWIRILEKWLFQVIYLDLIAGWAFLVIRILIMLVIGVFNRINWQSME